MSEWTETSKAALLERVANAIRAAYNTAPRTSNEHIQAAQMIAALTAIDEFYGEQQQPPTAEHQISDEGLAAIEAAAAAEAEPEPEPEPELPRGSRQQRGRR